MSDYFICFNIYVNVNIIFNSNYSNFILSLIKRISFICT